ncbi:MAG: hypothetical protein JWL90_2101 [Chthoniobacteraceae bacterium]|nr:hypothetical protein [Chthoniobacteraceae bacterium]
MRAGLEEGLWLPELERIAKTNGDDSCTAGLRELARAWLSRLAMRQVDAALLKFYRRQVRFPDSLGEATGEILKSLQLDAWGEPWLYKPAAPNHLKLVKQRYQLGTVRYPLLSRLRTRSSRLGQFPRGK